MLLRFGFKNHHSIREYQEISFVATKLKDTTEGLIPIGHSAPESSKDPLRTVPVVALYGANASGKSNALSALAFIGKSVQQSHSGTSVSEGTPHFPFLLDDTSQNEVSRYDADIVLEDTRFHYGFELDGKKIVSEWLYSYPLTASRQTRSILYHRDASQADEFYFGKSLKGENRQISRLVRPNSLFLSAAAQNAHPQLVPIFNFFAQKLTGLSHKHEGSTLRLAESLQRYFGEDASRRDKALAFLKSADVGICGIDFSKEEIDESAQRFLSSFKELLGTIDANARDITDQKEVHKVSLRHIGAESKAFSLSIDQESAGTLSLLHLLGPMLSHLTSGGLIVIDELNSTLHPLVSRELIKLFSDRTTNPGGAQLLFSTHDTNLLGGGILRRDQIYFAEKDDIGSTHLYSMSEIKVRSSENIESSYLKGRFGAVPFFGAKRIVARIDGELEH